MLHYAYPVSLVIGGIFVGLELRFIAAAGNQSTLKFAIKEGSYIAIFGLVLILISWLAFRP
jgi:hypothetical protein